MNILNKQATESDESPLFYIESGGVKYQVSFEKGDANYSVWIPSIIFSTIKFSSVGYPTKSQAVNALETLIIKVKESC